MRASLILFTIFAVLVLTSAPAAANPATLPEHPGYPMGKAIDPVTGQSLANDPGQGNATGDKALMEAAAFDDSHVMQGLPFTPNEQEVRDKLNTPAPTTAEQTQKKER
jgi:hypothetical protein